MKKTVIISGLIFISFFLISQGLFAQRYLRGGPGIGGDYYELNLTQEQLQKIDKLEIELEKELFPLFSKLRPIYMELEELEVQRSPDPAKIEKILDAIYKLEYEIQNKEILHEKKIRDLLTEDQKALLDSYSTYGANFYGRGGYGRGNFGRGYGGYGAGIGQNYMGRGTGRLDRGYYGYGNVVTRGLSRNVGYLGQSTGQLGYGTNPYLRGVRYGRGPCGAGLARWYRMGYSRSRWNWDR